MTNLLKARFRLIIHVLAIVFITQFINGCKNNDNSIVGEWRGMSNGEAPHPISLTFDKNHYASVLIGDAIVGGKNDNSGRGRKVELKYEVDYSKTPHTIQYTMVVDDVPNTEAFIKGIFRFISDDSLEIRMWLGNDEKFREFDSNDKENQTILTRVQ